jgi:hypothetical protein
MPTPQSRTLAHCAGKVSEGAVGRPAPSMPKCKCKKESHRSTPDEESDQG